MIIIGKATPRTPRETWHSVCIVPGATPCDAELANPRRADDSGGGGKDKTPGSNRLRPGERRA